MKVSHCKFSGEMKDGIIKISYDHTENVAYSASIKVPDKKEQALDFLDNLQIFLSQIKNGIQE